jgi:two-component system response regulator HydG
MARETGTSHTLSDEALRTLMEYEWPGNVRELEHSIDRACTLSSGPVLHLGDLPTQLQNFHLQHRRALVVAELPSASPAVRGPVLPLAQLEKEAILETLRKLNGDKLLAARLLGIGKTTLYRKLKEYGITAPAEGNDAGDHAN